MSLDQTDGGHLAPYGAEDVARSACRRLFSVIGILAASITGTQVRLSVSVVGRRLGFPLPGDRVADVALRPLAVLRGDGLGEKADPDEEHRVDD
jgi:hypothetical protein